MWINLPGLSALLTICGLCGFVVYAEYRDCDPLSTERIQASDQVRHVDSYSKLRSFTYPEDHYAQTTQRVQSMMKSDLENHG